MKKLLPLKKGDKIDSFWSINGQIYVKKTAMSDPMKISAKDSLADKLEVELDPPDGTAQAEPLAGTMD